MMNENVSSIMTTTPTVFDINDTIDKIKDLFLQKRIHHALILDGNKLAGIITTTDLFKLNRPFEDYPTIKASSVMTKHVAHLEPEDRVGIAAEVFLENLFHALPITKDGEVLGLVTSFDVLRYEFKKEYPNQEI
jgi:CBS domain-containing protein